MFAPNLLAHADPEVWNAVHLEHRRQDDHVELIASENYVSPAVLIAHGTQLTNKYAEGYPGKRYYGGCEYVDMVETIALERAKQLFGAPWRMCSRIRARRPTRRFTPRRCGRATRCSACRSRTAATSRTAHRSTTRASSTRSSPMASART